MSRLRRLLRSSFLTSGGLLVTLLVTVSLPASADWLVTTEGELIETQGPWKVDGRRIVYTSINGTLSAVRASSIDLEASDNATMKANAPKPKPVERKNVQPQKAALVLDQSTVGKHRSAPQVTSESEASESGDTEDTDNAKKATVGDVVVESWDETQDPGGELKIEGVVLNDSDNFATNIQVIVTAYDPDGNPSGTKPATLGKMALAVGGKTTFSVDFPGLYLTDGVTFKISNRSFITRKADDKDDDGSGASDQDPPETETSDGKR